MERLAKVSRRCAPPQHGAATPPWCVCADIRVGLPLLQHHTSPLRRFWSRGTPVRSPRSPISLHSDRRSVSLCSSLCNLQVCIVPCLLHSEAHTCRTAWRCRHCRRRRRCCPRRHRRPRPSQVTSAAAATAAVMPKKWIPLESNPGVRLVRAPGHAVPWRRQPPTVRSPAAAAAVARSLPITRCFCPLPALGPSHLLQRCWMSTAPSWGWIWAPPTCTSATCSPLTRQVSAGRGGEGAP